MSFLAAVEASYVHGLLVVSGDLLSFLNGDMGFLAVGGLMVASSTLVAHQVVRSLPGLVASGASIVLTVNLDLVVYPVLILAEVGDGRELQVFRGNHAFDVHPLALRTIRAEAHQVVKAHLSGGVFLKAAHAFHLRVRVFVGTLVVA